MKRLVCAVLVLVMAVAIGVLSPGTAADAQPMCSQGALVGDKCEVEGSPPVKSTSTCPTEQPGVIQTGSFCYRLINRVGAQCPQGTVGVGDGTCREAVALVQGPWVCTAGYELVGARCVTYVNPTCGPLGCHGKITLTYTVSCVGDGIARVALGTPILVNGAVVSFITVNGSAVVGADIGAGAAIRVVVTAERLTDEVIVTGPTVAPPCGVAAPTSTPAPVTATATAVPATPIPPRATAVPAPATTVPTAAPDPTAAATPTVESPQAPSTAEVVPTVVEDADEDGAVNSSEPPDQQEEIDGAAPACPPGQALVDLRCVRPCSEAAPQTECFDVVGTTRAVQAQPADAVPNDTSLPIVPLALIGGATAILAPAAYVFTSKRFS